MALGSARAHDLKGGERKRGGNISVDVSLIVLLNNTKFTNKFNYYVFKIK